MTSVRGDSVRVEVAGAFRLFIDGELVDVTRPQVRTVLALLATSSVPLSALELEDALWPSSIPSNPSAALRTIVSRTRSVLGPAAGQLTIHGNALSLTTSSDWSEVSNLVSVPDSEQDSAALKSLLDRVSGLPFSNVADSCLVDERRSKFTLVRERLQRQLIRLQLRDGDDSGAVDGALSILKLSPADEATACLGAQAMARLGRKTCGIELLQRTRNELASRGLEPSTELVTVENAILRNESDLSPSSVNPAVGRVDQFVGRASYLRELESLAPGRTLYVEGEAGIGKSSLLRVYSEQCVADGIKIVTARASATAVAPMSVIGDLVAGLLDLGDVDVAEKHRPSLAMLLPDRFPDSALPASREALVHAAADFVLEAADRLHVVLAIDDAQWLDHASLLMLRELVNSQRCRLLLFSRPGNAARVLGDAESKVASLTLGPLTADEAAAMVDIAPVELRPVDSSKLHRRSGGNPLFLHMLLDLLGHEIDVEGSLPPVILAAVQRRMQALSSRGRRVLQVASVIGTSFDEDIVVAIDPHATDGFSEAQTAGLIDRTSPDEASQFRHVIVADAAYQLLGEADRIALHDQVGRLLEERGADAITVFSHCHAAASLDAWRASEVAVEAAEQHLGKFDWEGAVRTASWAIDQGVSNKMYRLSIARARGELALGTANSHLHLIDGARQAQATGDAASLVKAVIEVCNSGSAALTGLDVEVVRQLVDAARVVADGEGLLDELHAAAARAFVYSCHGAFGQELYRESFERFEECAPSAQELLLRNSEAGLSNPNDFGLAQRATILLNGAADSNPELRWLARWFQYRDALIDGDGDRLAWALRDIQGSATSSERRHAFVMLGQTFDMDMQRSWAETTMALIHKDFDLAERCADRALAVGLDQLAIRDDGFGEGWVTASYGLLLLAIRHGQGRLAELVDVVETSAPLVPAWRVAIVIANHAAGNIDRVRRELEHLTADGFAALVPDPTWTAATFLLAEPVAHYCDPAVAVQLYDMISPFEDRMSYSGLCTFGPMHEACAVLAGALGKTDLEMSHREQARDKSRRLQQRSRWAFDELLASNFD